MDYIDEKERKNTSQRDDNMHEHDFTNNVEQISHSKSKKRALHFTWTQSSTDLLLKIRLKKEFEFNNQLRPRQVLWNEVAYEMTRYGGFRISGENCYVKYRNLFQTYKANRIKDKSGRSDHISWEYYKRFKDALDNTDENPEQLNGLNNNVKSDTISTEYASIVSIPITSKKRSKGMKRGPKPKAIAIKKFAKHGESQSQVEPNKNNTADITVPKITKIYSVNPNGWLIRATPKRKYVKRKQTWNKVAAKRQQSKLKAVECNNVSVDKDNIPPQHIQKSVEMFEENANKEHKGLNCSQKLSQEECNDCKIFGESVGTQMLNIKSSYMRSLIKFKIQQILFLAETGKLLTV